AINGATRELRQHHAALALHGDARFAGACARPWFPAPNRMSPMQTSFPRTLLFLLAGPIIWAAHFVFVYSVHGIACARPASHNYWGGVSLASWIIVAASLLALAAMALIYRHLRTRMPSMGNPGF